MPRKSAAPKIVESLRSALTAAVYAFTLYDKDASAARTTSGNGMAMDLYFLRRVAVEVRVTAVAGTSPTMDIHIEGSNDGTNWFDLPGINLSSASANILTFAQITAVGVYGIQIDVFCRAIRLYWTIGGTNPSFTFSSHLYGK